MRVDLAVETRSRGVVASTLSALVKRDEPEVERLANEVLTEMGARHEARYSHCRVAASTSNKDRKSVV